MKPTGRRAIASEPGHGHLRLPACAQINALTPVDSVGCQDYLIGRSRADHNTMLTNP
jgi:hypothetical protein